MHVHTIGCSMPAFEPKAVCSRWLLCNQHTHMHVGLWMMAGRPHCACRTGNLQNTHRHRDTQCSLQGVRGCQLIQHVALPPRIKAAARTHHVGCASMQRCMLQHQPRPACYYGMYNKHAVQALYNNKLSLVHKCFALLPSQQGGGVKISQSQRHTRPPTNKCTQLRTLLPKAKYTERTTASHQL